MSAANGVAGLAQATGADFPQITAARRRTEQGLEERRRLLLESADDWDPSTAILLFGSWGRREVTGDSDDDFIVLSEREVVDGLRPSSAEVEPLLGGRGAGREGTFGTGAVGFDALRENIGLDADNNSNLTWRMLLMLESVAVWGEEVHRRARRALLAEYLEAHGTDYQPPRFLLNDLVRYWRTIAVDFEGKMRTREGEGWGLRNAKLRLSRKALFAGGLLPVLECRRHPAAAMLDHLDSRMELPPLDRIADAFREHDAIDSGVRALQAYDEFLGVLDNPEQRQELQQLGHDDRRESPLFERIKELGEIFEACLLSLLFDDPDLGRLTREYLIF
jgi:hypothetical protein